MRNILENTIHGGLYLKHCPRCGSNIRLYNYEYSTMDCPVCGHQELPAYAGMIEYEEEKINQEKEILSNNYPFLARKLFFDGK
jgi:uncharacterized Zn finger protein (UPF0148 family)